MTKAPRASVVVAAHNVTQYLPRCVASLLEQTEEQLEVILVDDGSTDGTASLADRIASEDARVRVVHRPNGGVSAARNTGLHEARGEFVCFFDGDDWAEPAMIETMISWCETASVPVAMAGAYVDFHDHKDRLISSEPRIPSHHLIRRGAPLAVEVDDEHFVNLLGYAWNKIYRRDWLLRSGFQFQEGLNLFEDIDFNAKVLAAADGLVIVPEAFVHYVQRPRKSLGTMHDETFLSKQLYAIEGVDTLFEAWVVEPEKRIKRRAHASGMALWRGIRSAATKPMAKERLRRMIEQPMTERLIENARAGRPTDWRVLWASMTLGRHWYCVALLPVYASHAVKRVRSVRGQLFRGRVPVLDK